MKHFLRDRCGATAIEYAVIAAVVVLAMLAGLLLLGESSTRQFQNVADDVEQNM